MMRIGSQPVYSVLPTSYLLPNTIYYLPSTKIPIGEVAALQGISGTEVNENGFGAIADRRLTIQTSIRPRPRWATGGVQTHRWLRNAVALQIHNERPGSELTRLERSIERDLRTLFDLQERRANRDTGFVSEK